MSGAARQAARALPQLLDAHSAELAACRRCAGHLDPLVRPILSEARTPRVMLVGQAPGKSEIAARRPFAGRAGKTLFRWMERAGIAEAEARERIYIAAVTRCYPGPSPSGRGDRVPSPAERERCAHWLASELRIIRPALLVLVGRLAIDRFLDPAPLDQLIGRTHLVRHEGGESLALPLPHPSGASSWIHQEDHPALLERALGLLGAELRRLGVIGDGESAPGVGPGLARVRGERSRGQGGAMVGLGSEQGIAADADAGPGARPAAVPRGAPPENHDACAPAPAHHPSVADRTVPTRPASPRGAPPEHHHSTEPAVARHRNDARRIAAARPRVA